MQNAVGIKANKVESLPHCNKRKKDWHKHLALGTISKKRGSTKGLVKMINSAIQGKLKKK